MKGYQRNNENPWGAEGPGVYNGCVFTSKTLGKKSSEGTGKSWIVCVNRKQCSTVFVRQSW